MADWPGDVAEIYNSVNFTYAGKGLYSELTGYL